MNELNITFPFAREIGIKLGWADVFEAYKRKLLSPTFAQEMAVDELNSHSGQMLLQLAGSSTLDEALPMVLHLAEESGASPRQKIILKLVLTYLRRNETKTDRLLDLIEDVYADFDYPHCIADAVRYMPMKGPDLGSREANESRLVANLDRYLEAAD